jgi:hypothetical protein
MLLLQLTNRLTLAHLELSLNAWVQISNPDILFLYLFKPWESALDAV